MFAMDLDEAKRITVDLDLVPTRANIRRVVKAHSLFHQGNVRLQADFGNEKVYLVMSQNDPSKLYTVLRNGDVKCTCPDAQKDDVSLCKHSQAVLLIEEKEREDSMIAKWENEESNRFACDYELY
jgi:uncharacterized Zn finger protein